MRTKIRKRRVVITHLSDSLLTCFPQLAHNADWQSGIIPRQQRRVAFVLVRPACDACERFQFLGGNLSVLAFPTFPQWRLFHHLDLMVLQRFHQQSPNLMIPACLFADGGGGTRGTSGDVPIWAIHPSGFHHDAHLQPTFPRGIPDADAIFNGNRKPQPQYCQRPRSYIQQRHAGFRHVRVNPDD